jgi:hypothetical protein
MKKHLHLSMKPQLINRPLAVLLVLLSVSVMLNSCYKERMGIDKIAGGTWSPDLAAPIAYGDLTMARMIRDSEKTWKEYPDGLLSLIYEEKGISDFADKIITISDQKIDTTINFALTPGMNVGDSTFKYFVLHTEFKSNNNERLDSVLIKSGTLSLEVTTDMNHNGYLEVTIPSMTRYGVTFRQRLNFIYSGGATTTVSVNVPIFDYYLTLDNSGSNNNVLKQYVKVSATKSSNPDNSPYSFSLKQEIKDIKYLLAMGYFGMHTFNIDETKVPVDLFDNQTAGSIYIQDPHLYVTLRNSYGLPSNLTFDQFYAERNGVKKNITSSLLPTLPVNFPPFSNIGGSDTTIYHFHRGNSNIVDIIDMNPTQLVFEGNVKTNPNALVVPNFVLDTSHIQVDILLELPMYGRAMNFELRDTSDINGDNETNIDQLKSLQLNVNTVNGFPVDVMLQLYLADTNNVIIDSIFHDKGRLLKSGIVGPAPAYKVTSKTHNLIKIPLNSDQLESYKKARRLIMATHASSYENGSKVVKIYSDYSVFIEVAAKAKYETDF